MFRGHLKPPSARIFGHMTAPRANACLDPVSQPTDVNTTAYQAALKECQHARHPVENNAVFDINKNNYMCIIQ